MQVAPDGSFIIENIPSDSGLIRVQIRCSREGTTIGGESDFVAVFAGEVVDLGNINLGTIEPSPVRIVVSSVTRLIGTVGETEQLTVTASFPDVSLIDVTSRAAGTTYTTSNPAICTVSSEGLVTAVSSGTCIITAVNDGVVASIPITVQLDNDNGGDGLPNDFEEANACLNPSVADAAADPDGDGLTNLEEFNAGTDPCKADTDGDGLNDSQELAIGSNPVLPDSDLDGLLDRDETDPTGDDDGDGLINVLDPDRDDDGLPDGVEVALVGNATGADPFADNDGDGLTNIDEIVIFTDPGNPDTDGDGFSDGLEVLQGFDPLVPTPDPLTTVVGTVVDENNVGIAGATVTTNGGLVGLTEADSSFSIPNVPTLLGDIEASVLREDGATCTGISPPTTPVIGGVTDVGAIVCVLLVPLYPEPKFSVAGLDLFSMVVADLNADGIPDIVADLGVGGFSDNSVSVLLGNGNGTFQAPQSFAVGESPRSVAVADFNNDGAPDIVTANEGSDDVSVLLGNGDGTFQAQQSFGVGDDPISVAVADVNNDSVPDIVTANEGDPLFGIPGGVSVLLGNGDGTFQAPQSFAAGDVPQSVAVADLNNDGDPDIVTANEGDPIFGIPSSVSVLLGNGDGTFHTEFPQSFTVGDIPRSVAVADLNNDGVPDIVTANDNSGDVSVLLGNGDGTFQPQQRFAAGDFPRSVAVADLNNDGTPDIVTANAISDDVSVLLHR